MDKKCRDDLIKDLIINNRNSYYRLAYSYVHNREDSLDIIQEAIFKALSKSKTLVNPDAIASWFIRIITNTALDYIRKNKKYVYVEDEVLEVTGPQTVDKYEEFDLMEAIDKLPTRNKTVIILRFYNDMKLEEIAQIMNENVSTVKSRLYSSLKKLKLELDEEKVDTIK